MFHSNFVTYQVKTTPFDWEVTRRYSDFAWLREVLLQEYSLSVIPPVAEKSIGSNFEAAFVNKRMAFLQNFINYCITHPELKSAPALSAFLKIKDPTMFSTRKADLSKYKTLQTNFRDLYNSKGKKLFEVPHNLQLSDFLSLTQNVDSVIKI